MIVRDCFNTELVLPLTDRLGEVSSQVAPVEANLANTGVPVNFVLSVPPIVISALPTALGVRYKLNRDGNPWFTKLAKNPCARALIPWIPLNGSISNLGVWSVMRNKLTPGADKPPTDTVSVALRKVNL